MAGTISLDGTMVGSTVVSGSGVITGLVCTTPGKLTDQLVLRDASDGFPVVAVYQKDMGGIALARAMAAPFSGGLVASAVPTGSVLSLTSA
jgi:hypothetical protein